jgi:hypothetical protein
VQLIKVYSFAYLACFAVLAAGLPNSFASAMPAPLCSGAGSIRPGKGVGPVSLDMSVSDAGRALQARPQQSVTSIPTPGRTFFGFWLPHAVASLPLRIVAEGNRVTGITLESSGATLRCQLDNGIGITSTRGDIRRVLGAPEVPPSGLTAQWLVYDRLGVMFALATLGNPDPPASAPVTSIDVFAPDHLCHVYKERCAAYKFDVP